MNTVTQKPLPKMVNVGTITKVQLEALVKQFPTANFTCERGELVYKVRDTHRLEVLSAAIIRPGVWHVRAREGLVNKVV